MCSAKRRLICCLAAFLFSLWLLSLSPTVSAQQNPQAPPSPGQPVPEPSGPLTIQPWSPPPLQTEPQIPSPQQTQPGLTTPPQPESGARGPEQAQPGVPSEQQTQPETVPTAPAQAAPEWSVPPLFREYVPSDFPTVPPVGTLEPLAPNRFAPPAEVGPPPNLLIQPFITVSEAYNDNVEQTKNNKTGEFQTNIAPGIRLNYNRPVGSLNLVYSPSFYFPSNKEVDSNAVNQYLSLRGAWKPGTRLQFNVAEDFTQSNQSQDLLSPGTAYRGTGGYKTNTVAATAAYVAPQFRTALTYTNQFAIDNQQENNNNMTNAGNISAELTNPRTSLTGSYSLTRGDFFNAQNASYWDQLGIGRTAYNLTPIVNLTGFGAFEWHKQDEGDAFNYILGQGRVGATFNLAGNQSLLTVQGGALAYDPTQGGTKVRPSFLIGWTQRLAYNSSITASFESTYASNFSGVSPTGLSYVRTASLIFTTNYFRDIAATLGGNWYWQDYSQSTPSGGPSGTKQETWSLNASIQYLFSRFLTMSIFYNLIDQTSGGPSNGPYFQNIIGISVALSYDFR